MRCRRLCAADHNLLSTWWTAPPCGFWTPQRSTSGPSFSSGGATRPLTYTRPSWNAASMPELRRFVPEAGNWLLRSGSSRPARSRLFCFPYAGGNASAYRSWPDGLPVDVDVCLVELPGRATRWNEAPFQRLDRLVGSLAPLLAPRLDLPF